MATRPIVIGDPDKMDSFTIDSPQKQQLMGQIAPDEVPPIKPTPVPAKTPTVTIDPITGKKVYNGPKLRSRKVVDGKTWDNNHPNFEDKGVGGM